MLMVTGWCLIWCWTLVVTWCLNNPPDYM
jgi:hypothetical protein